MIRKNLTLIYRAFLRRVTVSILNILGLVIGITTCILILLYLENEYTYDSHTSNHQNVYRLGLELNSPSMDVRTATSSSGMAPLLLEEAPELEAFVRITPARFGEFLIAREEKSFYEKNIYLADENYFEVFDYDFKFGNPSTCLSDPSGIVISESLAIKLFGPDVNPVNEVIKLSNTSDFKVTGVFEDLPDNTHLKFDALISYKLIYGEGSPSIEQLESRIWSMNDYTFLVFGEGYNSDNFTEKFQRFYNKHMATQSNAVPEATMVPVLEPISKVHYGSDLNDGRNVYGNSTQLKVLWMIGILIVVLTMVNYINMTTAQATKRSKEVAIMKMLGTKWRHLVSKFMVESVAYTLIATTIAVALVEIILNFSAFNLFVGKGLSLDLLSNPSIALTILIFALVLGVTAGIYPSFYLSSLPSLKVLKGERIKFSSGQYLRKTLVVLQLVISIGCIAGAVIMRDQIDFLRKRDLGFDKTNLMAIPLTERELAKDFDVIQTELSSVAGVVSSAASLRTPGQKTLDRISYKIENHEGIMNDAMVYTWFVDFGYTELLGIELLKGRYFDKLISSDVEDYIVNEAFVKQQGWDEPIGKKIQKGRVIGVIKDFHIRSLHFEADPILLTTIPSGWGRTLYLRLEAESRSNTITEMESKWNDVVAGFPMNFHFIEQDFNDLYDGDKQQGDFVGLLSFICVIISGIGLLALSIGTVESKFKEIGIRKVLGASFLTLLALIARQFLLPMLISAIVAIPISYYLMETWLSDFAYDVGLQVGPFFVAIGISLAVIILTTSYQSVRAALRNPIESLRTE